MRNMGMETAKAMSLSGSQKSCSFHAVLNPYRNMQRGWSIKQPFPKSKPIGFCRERGQISSGSSPAAVVAFMLHSSTAPEESQTLRVDYFSTIYSR